MGKTDEIAYPLRLTESGLEYQLVKPFGSEFPQLCYSFSIMMSYLSGVSRDESIVDVGARPGWTTEWIIRCGFKNVFWMDISKHYEGIAGKRVGDSGVMLVGDMEDIPLDDESVEHVFCFDALHHTDEPERVVREFHRVVRKSVLLNEPSYDHPQHEQTVKAQEEYGVTEKGFRVIELHKMLKEAGFQKTIIRPADLPPKPFSRKNILNKNVYGIHARDILYNTPLMYARRLLTKGLIVYTEK